MGPIEPEEFDPTQYPPEYVTVEMDEAIHAILERVEEGWVRSPNVILIIPRGAQAFHNTHDFLALGKLPGARQVCVSIASPDPTIAGLARVLGFYIVDVPEGHPALTQDPTTGFSSEDDIEKPTSPLPLGAALGRWGTSNDWIITEGQQAPPPPKRDSLTTSTWLSNPEDYEPISADATPKIAEPKAPQPATRAPKSPVPPRTRPRQTNQLLSASLDSTSLGAAPKSDEDDPALRIPRSSFHAPHVSPTPSGRIKARSIMVPDETRIVDSKLRYGGDLEKSFPWGRLVAVLFLLIVAAVAGGIYYAFNYLPEGTVAVTPLETPITVPIALTILPGNLSGDSHSASLASHIVPVPLSPQSSTVSTDLPATLIKATITEEGTHPATGSRQVPRGLAQGTMRFTNQTTGPVAIPSGLRFKAANGVFVQTTQGGTIRATDFNSGVLGTIELPIASMTEGPDGNIGAGQLAGVYAGKLSYINGAMQGGTLETQKLVTEDDISALETQLRSQVDAKVNNAIIAAVPAGQDAVLITQTIKSAVADPTYSQKAGDVAESVTITLSAEVRAYTYSQSAVSTAVNSLVQDWVNTHYSGTFGPNLDKSAIQYTPLTLQAPDPATGKIGVATTASSHVTFTLTNELARQIRDLVKGKGIQQARSDITGKFGTYINTESIQARVLWLAIDKLPADAAHISVESTTRPSANPSGGSAPQTQDTSDGRNSHP